MFTALHALAASFLPQGHLPPPLVWTFTPEPPNPWGKEYAPSIRADISLLPSISTQSGQMVTGLEGESWTLEDKASNLQIRSKISTNQLHRKLKSWGMGCWGPA